MNTELDHSVDRIEVYRLRITMSANKQRQTRYLHSCVPWILPSKQCHCFTLVKQSVTLRFTGRQDLLICSIYDPCSSQFGSEPYISSLTGRKAFMYVLKKVCSHLTDW